MTNIFENAKFGDKFKTRDGRIAVFISPTDFYDDYKTYELQVQLYGTCEYLQDGRKVHEYDKYGHTLLDIVGKWKEPEDIEEMAIRHLRDNILYRLDVEEDQFFVDLIKEAYIKGCNDVLK